MRILSTLLIAAGLAAAAQTYTATNLQPANSPYQVANVWGLNNHGQVLVDICANRSCVGVNRLLGVWSNGVITPLPFPAGYTYSPNASFYHLNDSGMVVGTVGPGDHVVVWTNGVPAVLPDAPYSSGFGGPGCPSSANGSSIASGINAAGHIVGSTTYSPPNSGLQCSAFWVYNGSSFRVLPIPIPSQCAGLPKGYYPGVNVYNPLVVNDADQALGTLQNVFCAPPFITPGWPFGSDPFVVQANNNSSFLPLGSLSGATGTSINDVGDVLGYWSNGAGRTDVLVWDNNGLHDFGPSGYAYMNQLGQVVYLTTSCVQCGGSVAMWENGVSTPVQIPSGITGVLGPAALNDAGQIVIGAAGGPYLLTPSGPCAQDVTSQVQITRTGFRYNHSTGLFNLIGSVTNTSGAPIPGPISLVVDNLPASATLYGITGDTLCAAPQGSPYINIGNIGAGQALAPGAAISGSIEFIDTAQTGITYSLRVLAGPGGR